ncbi:hypothetical protein TNCV_2037391 [Trichonephila clavipes]|nr:hypothetical protein TNCV_2037391 [Trichonephila clavipes]
MQSDQLYVHPSTDDREETAYLGQENTFPRPGRDGLLYSLQTSSEAVLPFGRENLGHWSDSERSSVLSTVPLI